MNPPPTYHELLLKLNQITNEKNELILQLKETNQRLYESNETCEYYKKAYAILKRNELKISIQKSNL